MCNSDEEFQLLLNYPLLEIEKSDETTNYEGLIRVEDKDYRVSITETSKLNQKKFKLKSPKFKHKIKSTNILQCLDEVKDLLKINELQQNWHENHVNVYRRVLYEYSEFTRFHLNLKSCYLSDDLCRISIRTCDENYREHLLEISVNYQNNCDTFVPVNYDLPELVCGEFQKPSNSIVAIYDQFLVILEQLQDFFNIMDTLDRNCCILDPEIQQRKHCYRRIWINENLSILITIDPLKPNQCPDLKFLGLECLIEQYRQRFNDKLEEWIDEEWNILTGILTILDLEKFPKKPENNREILYDIGECCICFSLRLNDKIPEIICENQSCRNYFHTYCLYEWLMSINSKRIFNQIHGQCPNCEKVISCPVPQNQA